jgi:hypothetical protein
MRALPRARLLIYFLFMGQNVLAIKGNGRQNGLSAHKLAAEQ